MSNHGHVTPGPDGVEAPCGGPALCGECAKELGWQAEPQPARIGARAVAAAAALKPLGLSLLVSPDEFVITAGPDDKPTTVAVCTSIDEVEAFIADQSHAGTAAVPLKLIEQRPHVSLPVHYVSHGSPVRADGTQAYKSRCRAAIVTEVYDEDAFVPEHGVPYVGLCVLNPTGQFFNEGVRFDPGTYTGPERSAAAGEPLPLVTCADLTFEGGTWHWSVP